MQHLSYSRESIRLRPVAVWRYGEAYEERGRPTVCLARAEMDGQTDRRRWGGRAEGFDLAHNARSSRNPACLAQHIDRNL